MIMTKKDMKERIKARKNNAKYGHRKYKINENFFSKWSSDMAYILGFWWTDGCITTKKYIFSIAQHNKRKYILYKILKKMDGNYNIRKMSKNNVYCFQVCSFKLVLDIIRRGGETNKSLVCKFPNVPQKYLPDFFRGLWDGDGCICYNKSSKSYMSSLSSGSKKFIYKSLDVLRKNIKDLRGSIVAIKPSKKKKYLLGRIIANKNVNYQLLLGTNDTKRLRLFMYGGRCDFCLKDKKEKFLKCKNIRLRNKDMVFESYSKIRKFAIKNGIKSRKHWEELFTKNKLPKHFPSHPQIIYKNKGWISWSIFLNKNFVSLEKAKKIVRTHNIGSYRQWERYVKNNLKNNLKQKLPSDPRRTYKNKGWISVNNFLGKEWIPFLEAKKIAKDNKIKNVFEWMKYCKSIRRTIRAPLNLESAYKNKGWTNWYDFLGKENPRKV